MMMKSTLNIISLERKNFKTYKPEIIKLYRQVFSESNWKEGWKCDCSFQSSYSENPSGICPICNIQMDDYYSQEEIEGFVTDLFEREYFQALLGLNLAEEVVAFTWGWIDTLVNLNTEKFGLSNEDFKTLTTNLEDSGLDIDEPFYYRSETGVSSGMRGKGMGSKMIAAEEDMLGNNDTVMQIIQRTSMESKMFDITGAIGYDTVYEYADKARRVLSAKYI